MNFDLSKPAIIKPKFSFFWSFSLGGLQLLYIAYFVNESTSNYYSPIHFAIFLTPVLLIFAIVVIYESFKVLNGYKLFIVSENEFIAQKRKGLPIVIPLKDIEFKGKQVERNLKPGDIFGYITGIMFKKDFDEMNKKEQFIEYIEANNVKIDMRRIKNRDEIAETILLYREVNNIL